MQNLYLIETSIINGVMEQVVDRSCVADEETAKLIKSAVDAANRNSDVPTSTSIYPIDFFENKSEIPILNP